MDFFLKMILCQGTKKIYLTVSFLEYLVFKPSSNPVKVRGRIELSMVNFGQYPHSD